MTKPVFEIRGGRIYFENLPPGTTMSHLLVDYLKDKIDNEKMGPLMVQWVATSQCNFRCPHCGTAADEARPDEVTYEQIVPVLEELGEMGCKSFNMTGGEAILMPDFWKIVDKIHECGMVVGVVTNGWAIRDYEEELKKAKIETILVSIDGYRDNHDKMRDKAGSYEKCLDAIKFLKEIGTPTVGVSTVYLPGNIDLLEKIVEEVGKAGVDRHRLQAIVPEGRSKGKGNSKEEVKRAIEFVYRARKKGINVEVCEAHGWLGPLDGLLRPTFFCGVGLNTACIMQNGDVMGCSLMDYPEHSEGNIKERSFKDIWFNGFQKYREHLLPDLKEECDDCEYLKPCRGGCWLHRMNDNFCFLPMAMEVAKESGDFPSLEEE
ncbi:MAG: radical SAM protein [Thermoplasmata archaeon]|nr:radical SAM protein [Thermoplasmata archaeon]